MLINPSVSAAEQSAAAPVSAASAVPATQTLLDFAKSDLGGRIDSDRPALHETSGCLTLAASAGKDASVVIRPPGDHWDMDNYTRLQVEAANPGKATVRLRVRALDKGGSDWGHSSLNDGFLHPGQRKLFNVYLWRDENLREQYPALRPFVGMGGLPGGFVSHWHTIDAAEVKNIQIELLPASHPQKLEVFSVQAAYPIVPKILLDNPGFFPFVDKFGQYKWADWPGKVHSDAELAQVIVREKKDLAAHPPPAMWDKWGGWVTGPKLAATGAFRAAKHDGKWWLVDPDGHLFWSHGADCVGFNAGTPITGREKYFSWLPPQAGEWAFAWPPAASGKSASFDYLAANLFRQYGPDWRAASRALAHERLHSWGMNTIGNWSDAAIEAQDKTPYTVSLWPWCPEVIPGMFDVFRPDFAATFNKGIQDGVKDSAKDPWCIGYFVHNELGWSSDPVGFVGRILSADPSMATKQEFLKTLRAAFPDVAAFDAKTGAHFADWDAVAANRSEVPLTGIAEIADAFYSRYCERYFETVDSAIHKYAPGRLYLGCRWNVSNLLVIRAAARYCDALSFNVYESDVNGLRPADVDKPLLVSEFHFGDLDRGMFSTGLQGASDEQDRADKYRCYVTSALRNPYVVGTHWFAFSTEPLTGRGDGENHECGLSDICNDPYPELRAAIRDVGDRMYAIRSGAPPPESGSEAAAERAAANNHQTL
jgi:hypothetical protein